jgi:hypothetical protein
MAKTEWGKLQGNPTPNYFACIDSPITLDEDTVVLYSKKEPDRDGFFTYHRSGNSSKIIKAEWRKEQNSSYKFVYILHEDKSSEYITNGGSGVIADSAAGIGSKEYAQPEDYQNFPQTKDKDIANSNGTTKKEKPEIKSSSNNHKRSLIGWLFFIPWWIIKTLFKTIFWFFK